MCFPAVSVLTVVDHTPPSHRKPAFSTPNGIFRSDPSGVCIIKHLDNHADISARGINNYCKLRKRALNDHKHRTGGADLYGYSPVPAVPSGTKAATEEATITPLRHAHWGRLSSWRGTVDSWRMLSRTRTLESRVKPESLHPTELIAMAPLDHNLGSFAIIRGPLSKLRVYWASLKGVSWVDEEAETKQSLWPPLAEELLLSKQNLHLGRYAIPFAAFFEAQTAVERRSSGIRELQSLHEGLSSKLCKGPAYPACALNTPTRSNRVIGARRIPGNAPVPVLVVPDDEDNTLDPRIWILTPDLVWPHK
ncbi:hypothetical protein BC629DRAFT_1438929 [Irpex lacteus]|nr:hypothetical protein BC629DRAFT_1438929 [Irpex lacteus]